MPNPFFTTSTLPYQLPPFADIVDAHYEEAFAQGMTEQLAELSAITRKRDVPTFENTFPALESSGQTLTRVTHVFFNKSSADSTDFTNELEERLAPRLAAHRDAILLDTSLYHRVVTVYESLAQHDALTPEDRYLVERWYLEMTLAGAGLDDAQKERLTQLVTLVLPTGHPFLAELTNSQVRAKVMAASRARGSRGGSHDNTGVLLEIVRLRAERAELLGFANHAAHVTKDETAGSPDAVAAMLDRLAPVAAKNAREEQAELETLAGSAVTAADWSFFTEKVRQAKFDVDTAALRPWFEAERVLQLGVFGAATALYGVTFTERTDLVAYHPEVRVFEVRNDDDSPVGLYLLDLYTRDSKRGGAWMNDLVAQNTLLDQPVVVVNNLNVPKPAAGEPTLLTFDEVSTFFHEFGHALHGLFARVTYPKLAGTNVFRDFVEFPSQVNEMWMLWPEVLEQYAIHHQTGEPIDAGVVQRIRDSETFNQGFATSEYLAAALLDQAWHTLSRAEADAVTDVAAFEAAALAAVGLDNPAVPSRYSSLYFAHAFAGGYDAGYYSYIWSEVLDADTVEWFRSNGGLTRANGDRFRDLLLGVGGSKDPLEAYREFRGRDAVIEPLLTRRGLD